MLQAESWWWWLDKVIQSNNKFSTYIVRLKSGRSGIQIPRACDWDFLDRVIPVTSKLAFQWIPCQAPGVIGSALGLVSPVSVYCDWVRYKVWAATSISVWQHVKLSVQIRPWHTLACCWDINPQPTNKQFQPTSGKVRIIISLPTSVLYICLL